jgi:pilus assembly protein CpaB
MNPRQRRGLFLMILASLGVVMVVISVSGYVAQERASLGKLRDTLPVYQLATNVGARQPVAENQLRQVQMPREMVTDAFVRNLAELNQRMSVTDLPAGAYLQRGMLMDRPTVRPGQRAIAIMVDAETGVAGKVRPGDVVDVFATYQIQVGDGQQSCAERVIANALVLDVASQRSESGGSAAPEQVIPITFVLDGRQSINLTLNESFSTKIRVALVGDQSPGNLRLPKICDRPGTNR